MSGKDIVFNARQLYVSQFREFLAHRRASSPLGGRAEPMLSVANLREGPAPEYEGLIVIDYIENLEEQTRFWEFEPPTLAEMDSISGEMNGVAIEIVNLRWDNVFVFVEPALDVNAPSIKSWFNFWFDQGGQRYRDGQEFAEVIHRLIVTPTYLNVDLGTAPPEAFANLIECLGDAGVRSIRVAASASAAPT